MKATELPDIKAIARFFPTASRVEAESDGLSAAEALAQNIRKVLYENGVPRQSTAFMALYAILAVLATEMEEQARKVEATLKAATGPVS